MSIISIMGCGWLGLPLGERLVKAGYVVKGSTTREDKKALLSKVGITPSLARFNPELEGDISDLMQADVLIINIPPGKGDGQPQFYLRLVQHLLPAIERSDIDKVIFVSATSVYPQNNEEVREEDAIRIQSPHSDTAWLDVEQLFTENTHFRTTILRFSGLIGGEYQPGRYFSGRELGGADDPVNMIHQEDCIRIIQKVIEQSVWGEVFNASADQHPTRRQLYSRSTELMGVAPPIFKEEPRPYRIVNCDKLKRQLDYEFVYPDPLLALGQ